MSFVEDKQVIEALSSHRLHPPLRNRVRPGRSERRSHLLSTETPQAAIESRDSDCHDRESETAVAIDPKRSTPLFAGLPTLPSERALSQRAGFPGSRAGLQKRHRASETGLFGRRRNRIPICLIHGVSRIFANARMALDCVANSYTLRQSSQNP
jgi:hypothetical protein